MTQKNINQLLQAVLLISICMPWHTAWAESSSPLSLGLGVKLLWPAGMEIENQNTEKTVNSDSGAQLGLNLVLQKGRFYTGLNLQGGNYRFNDETPQQTPDEDSETINRSEFDLLVGYYFWERISLFVDLKAINNEWQDQDYKLGFGGLGLGISGFIPLTQKWLLFGSLGFVPVANIEENGKNAGDGTSAALEFGGIYNFNHRNRINFGFKAQQQTYNFDDDFNNGQKQTHGLFGLFVGYNHLFLFD